MTFASRLLESKARTELFTQGLRRVPDRGKSAALWRPFEAKRGEDERPSHSQSLQHAIAVSPALDGVSQEVKDGPIVPDVHGRNGPR